MSEPIKQPGTYRVRTFCGDVHEINVTERDGELGVFNILTGNFVRVRDFVNVTVLSGPDA